MKKNNTIAGSILLIALVAGCSSGNGSTNGNGNNNINPPAPSPGLTPPSGPINYEKIKSGFIYTNKNQQLKSKNLQDNSAYSCGVVAGKVSSGLSIFSNFLSFFPIAGEAFGTFKDIIKDTNTIFGFDSKISSCQVASDLNIIIQQLAQQQQEINNIEYALNLSDNQIWSAVANTNIATSKLAYSNFNSYLSSIMGSGINNSLLFNFYSTAGFFDTNMQESTNYTINALLSESGVPNLQMLSMALTGISITTNLGNSLNNLTGAYIPRGTTCSKEASENGTLIPACYQNVIQSPNSNLLALLNVYQNTLVSKMISQLSTVTPNTNVIPLIDDYNNSLTAVYQQALAAIQQVYHIQYMINYINYYQQGSTRIALPNLWGVPGTYYSGLDSVSYLDAQKNLTLYASALINQLYQNIAGYIVTDNPVGNQFYPIESYTVESSTHTINYSSIIGALLPANMNTATKLVNYALLQGTSSIPTNPYQSLVNNLSQMNLVYYQYPGIIDISKYTTNLESYNSVTGGKGTLGNALQSMESVPNIQIFTDTNGSSVNKAVFSINTIQPYTIAKNGPLLTGNVTNNVNTLACESQTVGNVPAWNMYFYTPSSDTVNYPSLGTPNIPYLMCGNWVADRITGSNPSNKNGTGFSYGLQSLTYYPGLLIPTNDATKTTTINFLNPTYIMNVDNNSVWSNADASNLSTGSLKSSILSHNMNSFSAQDEAVWGKFGSSAVLINNVALQTIMPDGFIAPFGISMLYPYEIQYHGTETTPTLNAYGFQIGISPNPNVITANVTINGKPIYDVNNIGFPSNNINGYMFNAVPYNSVNNMIESYPWTPVYSTNSSFISTVGSNISNMISAVGINGWMLIPNATMQSGNGNTTVCITNPQVMQGQASSATTTSPLTSYRTAASQLITNPCYDNYYRINTNPNAISGSVLATNASLFAGGNNTIISPNGTTELVMQTDGNLVVYHNGVATWATPGTTIGSGSNNQLIMQDDGNLVIYSGPNLTNPVWASGTSGSNLYLSVQDDGNVVIYNHSGQAVWSTGT